MSFSLSLVDVKKARQTKKKIINRPRSDMATRLQSGQTSTFVGDFLVFTSLLRIVRHKKLEICKFDAKASKLC